MTLAVWLSLMVILGPSYLHALDLPDYATAIDAKTKAIDQLTTHVVKKTLLTGTDGGGTLSASWHEGDICHLTIIIGMSNRRVTNSYYYDHGRVIFSSSEQAFFGWDKDSQKLNQNKIAIAFQDKYYFVDGKLTIWNTDRMGADLSRHDSNVSKENETVLQQSSVFVRAARQESNSVDVEAFIKSGTH